MTETVITVQGHYSQWYDAEQATARVTVQCDGGDRDSVFAAATTAAAALRASVESRYNVTTGPITSWAADTVRVWSQRPWNDRGEQLDPVHYAALDLTATFSAFEALAEWIEEVVAIEHASVSTIEWALTEPTITAATIHVRSLAVTDAVAKATSYAGSLALTTVTPVAIADPGMLGDAGLAQPGFERMAMKASFDAGGGAPLALRPEKIEVACSVDARFVAH